jgi:putative Ca2+/H+ antiporter (TMEM165/GDT1 family)
MIFIFHSEAEELKEVEEKLNADFKTDKRGVKSKDDDDLKKQQRSFLLQLFSPIFLKAFSITFFGEWGDKSQIATIAMASDEDPFGVVLGGILGQALCTTAAVIGGKSLASQISEKMVIFRNCVKIIQYFVLLCKEHWWLIVFGEDIHN